MGDRSEGGCFVKGHLWHSLGPQDKGHKKTIRGQFSSPSDVAVPQSIFGKMSQAALFLVFILFKNFIGGGARKMAQWLRVRAALSEDLG